MTTRARALAQGLHRPAGVGVEDAVRGLLAVQAQDLRSARRAIRARTRGTTAAGVDARLDDRSLVVTWLNRGTLHLVAADDLPWLLGLTAPAVARTVATRLRDAGVRDPEPGVARIVAALADGPRTHRQLAERLPDVPRAAVIHLLVTAGLRGLTVRGPVTSAAGQAFALTQDWLGIPPPGPLSGAARDAALAELARRYLRAHGPASAADLAAWSGLPLRDARLGLGRIAGELEQRGEHVTLAGGAAEGRLAPRLLGSFDPLLLGWKRRDHVLAPALQPGFLSRNGILPAVALVGGRAVALWRTGPAGLELEPFDERPLPAAALERDHADVERFERS